MKLFLATILFILGVTISYGQSSKDIEGIFLKVNQGEAPASFYTKGLKKIESKDKRYNLALFLLYKAYTEKADSKEKSIAYSRTALFYDSAIYYLEQCKTALQKSKFSKYIDYYLPIVNEYGIYDNEEQVRKDLFSFFQKELTKLNKDAFIYKQLSSAFQNIIVSYTELITLRNSITSRYPVREDILILTESDFSKELRNIKAAQKKFENALESHNNLHTQYEVDVTFNLNSIPFSRYEDKSIPIKSLMQTGQYSDIGRWISELEKGRIEKLGDFWTDFSTLYKTIQINIAALSKGVSEVSKIEIEKSIYQKIKFIDPNSSIILYLDYLEQKQDFLFNKALKESKEYHTLVQLYSFLQQGKLSLSILEKRKGDSIQSGKDLIFFERLNINQNDLTNFILLENEFLYKEELEISKQLKKSLVDDFLLGQFNPHFAKFENTLIPLYEQKVDFIKRGEAVTTDVLKIDDRQTLISGTVMDGDVTPFIAMVKDEKISWLTKDILPNNALSFANNFDYYHCTSLFKTDEGWGGVYYPGFFDKSSSNEKQSGLLVLFDEGGNRKEIFPLPVMHRVDVACFNQALDGYILLIENEYLSDNYWESEILFLSKKGEVKWKRSLPIKSFNSKLNTERNSIFLFANCIEKIPGEQHIKSSVHIFELNAEGVVIKDKALGFSNSSYTTQVMQDTDGNWLVFGFKGNNDLYNLRYKDVFFYMLDKGFDAISGGELTSIEKP